MLKVSFKYFFFLSLINSSCSTKSGNKESETIKEIENKIRDTVYFNADTINNRPIGKGFYMNNEGDIFELKRTGFGNDSGNFWSAYWFLDDKIQDDVWDNPGKLKKYIDIETYTEDSMGGYSKDKNHVYWSRSTSDGQVRYLMHGADPETFVVYGANMDSARDRRYVYYEGIVLSVKNK